ncbi:MAG: ABC transporter permease, partial [Gemmatimonadaceae bacterium]
MSNLIQDLRYARRILTKSPLFTAVVVVTLAIGIGLNTAVFSAVDTLILKPLPGVRAPDELVQLYRSYPGNVQYGSNSIPHFHDVRDQSSEVFSSVAGWTWEELSLSADGRARAVFGMATSANFFSMFGVNPFRGRMFVPAEDSGANAHPVAVLSYQGWQQLFGGDSGIVGRTVIIDGRNYSIIGITPQAFHGPQPIAVPDFYVPFTQINQLDPGTTDRLTARDNNFIKVTARLRPG